MADITQTLGFDAGQALAALQQLDGSLATFEARLQSTATALNTFKTGGRGIAGGFTRIGNAAGTATTALNSFHQAAAAANQAAVPQTPANIQALIQTLTQVQSSLNGLVGSANKAQAAINKLATSSGQNLKAAQGAASKLVVTFGTLARVVQTQLIVRALSTLRSGLEDSVGQAIKFETQLAQIQTIGGQTVGSLGAIGAQVRALSEEFAQPIEDVAQGFYDILSNQIGNAADSALVLRESLLLSKVAVSSTADAANALSSIINSYNLNASDAADISGKLFAAVDVGRFVLSDIANTIGRVTTLGAEMGVTLDEVLASLSTLTINGVKADEAMTLLSNAMRGLLKPTKAMQAAFAELNVDSAEIGIATFGFQGFLEKLRETTNGTASEITQLTENIRVGRGVFGLTGKAAEQYQKALEEIRKSGAQNAREKSALILETNAQQVQKEFTELRNLLVVDFGQKALPVIKELFDAFGVEGKTGILAVTDSLLFFLSSLAKAQKEASEFWGPIITGALRFSDIITLGIIPGLGELNDALTGNALSVDQIRRKQEVQFNEFSKNVDQEAALLLIAEKKKQTSRQETIDIAFKSQLELAAQVDAIYKKDRDSAVAAQKQITDRIKGQLKERLSLIEKVINELEKKQQDSQRIVDKNRKESADLFLKGEEKFFDRRIRFFSEEQKAVLDIQRSQELSRRASDLANKQDFEGADELLQNADARANAALELADNRLKEAKSSQEQFDAQQQILSAENEVKRVLQERLNLRAQENKLAEEQAAAAQKEIVARREQLKDAKELIGQITKFQVLAKDEGKSIGDRETAKKAIEPLAKQLESVLSRGDLSIEQFLGIQDFTKKIRGDFESALDGRPVSLNFAFQEGINDIFNKLNGHRVEITGLINKLELSSEAKFSEVTGAKEIRKALVDKKNELGKAINDLSGIPQSEANLKKTRERAGKLALDPSLENANKFLRGDLTDVQAEAEKAIQGQANILEVLIDHFLTARKEMQAEAQTLTGEENQVKRDTLVTGAETLFTLVGTLKELQDGAIKLQALKNSESSVTDAINQNQAVGLGAEFDKTKLAESQQAAIDKAKELNVQTAGVGTAAIAGAAAAAQPLDGLKGKLDAAATSAARLKAILNDINAPDIEEPDFEFDMRGGVIRGFNRGGRINSRYFAKGGLARGTDTIPTMLGSGETVVDAKNSSRFFSQLQAIRAGVTPNFDRSPGVTHHNTTVGDIIIQGAQQPNKVAREVMSAIKREQRRNTSRL